MDMYATDVFDIFVVVFVSVWLPDELTSLDLWSSVVIPQVHEMNVRTIEDALEALEVEFLHTQLFHVIHM